MRIPTVLVVPVDAPHVGTIYHTSQWPTTRRVNLPHVATCDRSTRRVVDRRDVSVVLGFRGVAGFHGVDQRDMWKIDAPEKVESYLTEKQDKTNMGQS